jgi:SAM-dependent methyltransferase
VRHEDWLKSGWSFVRAALPAPPAYVLEIGCGPAGGFVPALLADGYAATGIDPNAPEGAAYLQAEFESYDPPRPPAAVVASTSLHHVADLDVVLDRVAAALKPDGRVVVIEWAIESFDEPTARWCFGRLPAPGPDDEHNWLRHRQDEWLASGQPWPEYIAGWRAAEGLHRGQAILRGLDARFSRRSCDYGPYFFPDLDQVTEAGEQAAIDTGQIRATRIRYAGILRPL